MGTDDKEPRGEYVPVLVLECQATPKQRRRNARLHRRLLEGPPPERLKAVH